MVNKKICIKCNVEKTYSFFYKTPRNKTGVKNTCKQCIAIYDKEYNLKNKDKIKKVTDIYYINNKEKSYNRSTFYRKINSEKLNLQIKLKKENNSLYKLKCSLRCRTTNAFKSKRWCKDNKLKDILGCSYTDIKSYLESKFSEGMSWNNHGKWHIDHIIPLTSASTKEELIKLCHYSNLQPLWAKDNIEKGCKLSYKISK